MRERYSERNMGEKWRKKIESQRERKDEGRDRETTTDRQTDTDTQRKTVEGR